MVNGGCLMNALDDDNNNNDDSNTDDELGEVRPT